MAIGTAALRSSSVTLNGAQPIGRERRGYGKLGSRASGEMVDEAAVYKQIDSEKQEQSQEECMQSRNICPGNMRSRSPKLLPQLHRHVSFILCIINQLCVTRTVRCLVATLRAVES